MVTTSQLRVNRKIVRIPAHLLQCTKHFSSRGSARDNENVENLFAGYYKAKELATCKIVCPLECTSNEMKLQDRNMSRQDAPGSPSCPSHTRAATSSPLSGCRPYLVKQLKLCKSHTRLRRGLRAGLMGRPSASQESQDPQRCRAVCVASVYVVIIM